MTNETDRKLLELAAKAAGEKAVWFENTGNGFCMGIEVEPGNPLGFDRWNPLEDDGDALRLLMRIGGKVDINHKTKRSYAYATLRTMDTPFFFDPHCQDSSLATRRAIVRLAAEIGRTM